MIESTLKTQRFAAEQFDVAGNVESCVRYGNGHIHESFLVEAGRKRYLMQHININVFKNPDSLMKNMETTTEYLSKKAISRGENPERTCLTLVKTRQHRSTYTDIDGQVWRMFPFIEGTVCLEQARSLSELYEAAKGFGRFAADLSDFPAKKLCMVIPDFHATHKRYEKLCNAEKADICHRAESVSAELQFVHDRAEDYRQLSDYLKTRSVPCRVLHNDTKLNNVLLNEFNGHCQAVIDLDTVMPGALCWDFGDFTRYACKTAAEDEKNLDMVHFSMKAFEASAEGYLSEVAPVLTRVEMYSLVKGVRMMPLECGIRFLTDYLENDTYFHTSYEGQNLDRCRTQFRITKEIEDNYREIDVILRTLTRKYNKK